jgi:chitinase
MRRFLLFFAATFLAMSPAQSADRGVAIGYIAAFKGLAEIIERGGFENYTHLDLAFVNPSPSGEFLTSDSLACAPAGDGSMVSDTALRTLVASAHQAGAKVLISLGGADIPPCGGDWTKLLAPQSRIKVVDGLADLVDRYGLDGVDIDLEGELLTRIDRDGNYTPFVRDLAAKMHARSRLVTAATGSYPGGMVPDASLPYFDLIGIMSYDAIGPTWGPPGGEHSSYVQAQEDLALWIRKGVPAAKLALGLPFYGRGFGKYRPNWALREIAAELGERELNGDVVGQRCAGCDYITFNGLPTLERKARLAGAWGAGVMVWETEQDLPDNRAIRRLVGAYRDGRSNAPR